MRRPINGMDRVTHFAPDMGAVRNQGDKSSHKGGRFPVAVWYCTDQALSHRRPAVAPCHRRAGPSLIDEDESFGSHHRLSRTPRLPPGGDIGPILFSRAGYFSRLGREHSRLAIGSIGPRSGPVDREARPALHRASPGWPRAADHRNGSSSAWDPRPGSVASLRQFRVFALIGIGFLGLGGWGLYTSLAEGKWRTAVAFAALLIIGCGCLYKAATK